MSGSMRDHELRELLRDLPRESPSPEFRARMMAGLDRADRRARLRQRAAPALAFAVALVLAATTALYWSWQRREQRIEQARLENLELQYQDIAQDFQELQRMVAAAQPVVGIEGPGERGYVVDLPELAKARAEGSVPVAYRIAH
jgi:hypothetical protein